MNIPHPLIRKLKQARYLSNGPHFRVFLLGIVNTTAAPAVNLFYSAQFLSQSIISLDILAILFS